MIDWRIGIKAVGKTKSQCYLNDCGGVDYSDAPRIRDTQCPTGVRKQVNDTRRLKQQLMEELSTWIAEHHLKQAEAAEILVVLRPRVSDVVNKKTAKFTIDTLVEMLSRVGKPVKLAIG